MLHGVRSHDRDQEDLVMSIAEEILDHFQNLSESIEWSGFTADPPVYQGGPVTSYTMCCPVCGGLKPGQDSLGAYSDKAVGHRKRCRLSMVIKALGGGK